MRETIQEENVRNWLLGEIEGSVSVGIRRRLKKM